MMTWIPDVQKDHNLPAQRLIELYETPTAEARLQQPPCGLLDSCWVVFIV